MSSRLGRKRAPRNKTVTLCAADRRHLVRSIYKLDQSKTPEGIVKGDCLKLAPHLPAGFVDLLFLDPPYNLTKSFHGVSFQRCSVPDYSQWLDRILSAFKHTLKEDATIYICGDWVSSASIFEVASSHFRVRNRITWEREKGRGALRNWKNASEDVWFCTMSSNYVFNVEAVKLRRKVIAPYTNSDGTPKDWNKSHAGNFRDTHPSNIWTDITIPFWSMPENTDHPTQKSEKLLAKLLLASTKPGGLVFDPFMGSGTTCVVAQKLGRRFLGIDINQEYVLWALKRLEAAVSDRIIQGYTGGVFWERNSIPRRQEQKTISDDVKGSDRRLSIRAGAQRILQRRE